MSLASSIYVAYCAVCDAGWASRSVHLVEQRARNHAGGGKLSHLIDVIEVEMPKMMAEMEKSLAIH